MLRAPGRASRAFLRHQNRDTSFRFYLYFHLFSQRYYTIVVSLIQWLIFAGISIILYKEHNKRGFARKGACFYEADAYGGCHWAGALPRYHQIIPGVKKGPVFQKGHIIAPEDVPVLLSVGKEHVYIWEKDDTRFHENEAARILCEMSRNDYMDASEPSEGKIELTAQVDGLFTLDRQRLYAVNSLGEMMIATRHAGPVKKGDKLAGMRVIPLVIEKEKMAEARETAGNTPLLTLTPYRALKVGLVTTGSEVYYGRIQDQFTPVIKAKLAEYGAEVTHHVLLPDDHAAVTEKIKEFLADGVDMVLCTGGMSVDPDDKTPLAIKNAGVNVVTYGAPVLPGAMFLLSYTDDGRPVCGLPGCVMYAKRTIFDLVLPYLAAGVPVTREQIAAYGEGGLCLNCKVCTWPNCGFGKGV